MDSVKSEETPDMASQLTEGELPPDQEGKDSSQENGDTTDTLQTEQIDDNLDEGGVGGVVEENEEEMQQESDDLVPTSPKAHFSTEEEDVFGPLLGETEEDSLYLHDVTLGFDDPANIKRPLSGYTDGDQNRFFPKIDEQSGILFEVVQHFETGLFKSSEKLLLNAANGAIVPSERLEISEGGPPITIRYINSSELATSSKSTSASSSPEKVPEKLLAALATDAFTPEKLAELMVPLEKGWTREIVMRSHGGGASKKLGDVYYFAPGGTKYRSSKQIALYLAKHPSLGMTIENFTFAKARVSFDPAQETVRQANGSRAASGPSPRTSQQPRCQPRVVVEREILESTENDDDLESEKRAGGRRSIQPPKRYAMGESVFHPETKKAKVSNTKSVPQQEMADFGGMEMGMLPPKYPRGMEDSSKEGMSGEEMLMEFKRRGRPPKPGGKKDLLMQQGPGSLQSSVHVYNEEDEGALFGISAFTQSAHYGHIRQGMEMNYGNYGGGGDEYEGVEEEEGDVHNDMGSSSKQLLPCSIRCPGRAGQIPTLQCKRCLCLYHTKCLGLPSGLYRNFHCANCEDDKPSERNPQQKQESMSISFVGGPRNLPMNNRVMPMDRIGEGRSPPALIQLSNNNFSKIRRIQPGQLAANSVPGQQRRMLPRMPSLQAPSFGPGGGMASRQRMPTQRMHHQGLSYDRPGMSVSSIDMRSRGRGRPPRNMIPIMSQMNQKSLTITPISMRTGRISAPVVPKLQPVSGAQVMRRAPQMPLPIRPLRGGIRHSLPVRGRPVGSGSSATQTLNQLTGEFSQRMPTTATVRKNPQTGTGAFTMRMPGPQKLKPIAPNSTTRLTHPQTNTFKRYPESVVTINNKKYIVVPKGSARNITQVKPRSPSEEEKLQIDEHEDTVAEISNNEEAEPEERANNNGEADLVSEGETNETSDSNLIIDQIN